MLRFIRSARSRKGVLLDGLLAMTLDLALQASGLTGCGSKICTQNGTLVNGHMD